MVTYTDTEVNSANQQNYTFNSVSFGTEDADRYIFVGAYSNGASGGGGTVSSMTIGGVGATLASGGLNPSDNTIYCAIWYAAVPTGTTGTVQVNHSDTRGRCGITVWNVTTASLTLDDTSLLGTSVTSNPSVSDTLNVPTGGYVLAAAGTSNSNAITGNTWTGTTQDTWTVVESNAYVGASTASVPGGETGRSIGLSLTSTSSEIVYTALSLSVGTVGPAGVKTWDGVTQSTGIKQYFGVDLANVKTVNGVS